MKKSKGKYMINGQTQNNQRGIDVMTNIAIQMAQAVSVFAHIMLFNSLVLGF